MVDHIYGRTNIIRRQDRPHMFIKELKLYVNYLKDEIRESLNPLDEKQRKFIEAFRANLSAGIAYYRDLFSMSEKRWAGMCKEIQEELTAFENDVVAFSINYLESVRT